MNLPIVSASNDPALDQLTDVLMDSLNVPIKLASETSHATRSDSLQSCH